MKNYYQQKKGGWTLEPVIYAKTVKLIQCYRHFERILHAPDPDPSSCILARVYIDAIDRGLKQYVPSEYQDAVFAHLTDGVKYADLEAKYYISVPTMKRYTQVFVWGVAEELGESFRI